MPSAFRWPVAAASCSAPGGGALSKPRAAVKVGVGARVRAVVKGRVRARVLE